MTTKRIRKAKSYKVTLKLVLYRNFYVDAPTKLEAIENATELASHQFRKKADHAVPYSVREQDFEDSDE